RALAARVGDRAKGRSRDGQGAARLRPAPFRARAARHRLVHASRGPREPRESGAPPTWRPALIGFTSAAPRIPRLVLPIERFELACGAVLLVSPRKEAPVAAAYAHMRGGPALDPPGLGGSAYLVGALADQVTRVHDEEEIANLLEPAGGEISGD